MKWTNLAAFRSKHFQSLNNLLVSCIHLESWLKFHTRRRPDFCSPTPVQWSRPTLSILIFNKTSSLSLLEPGVGEENLKVSSSPQWGAIYHRQVTSSLVPRSGLVASPRRALRKWPKTQPDSEAKHRWNINADFRPHPQENLHENEHPIYFVIIKPSVTVVYHKTARQNLAPRLDWWMARRRGDFQHSEDIPRRMHTAQVGKKRKSCPFHPASGYAGRNRAKHKHCTKFLHKFSRCLAVASVKIFPLFSS